MNEPEASTDLSAFVNLILNEQEVNKIRISTAQIIRTCLFKVSSDKKKNKIPSG